MTTSQVTLPDIHASMAEPEAPAEPTDPVDDDARRKLEAHHLASQGKTQCTSCGKVFDTEVMVVMRVEFRTAPKRDRKVLQTRTAAKLCPDCLEKHPQWNLPISYI